MERVRIGLTPPQHADIGSTRVPCLLEVCIVSLDHAIVAMDTGGGYSETDGAAVREMVEIFKEITQE